VFVCILPEKAVTKMIYTVSGGTHSIYSVYTMKHRYDAAIELVHLFIAPP